MAALAEPIFKYPAEDECLVRRLGAGVMGVWPSLTPETREKILAEAKVAWDREFHVPKLVDRLEAIIKRYNTRR